MSKLPPKTMYTMTNNTNDKFTLTRNSANKVMLVRCMTTSKLCVFKLYKCTMKLTNKKTVTNKKV